VEEIIATLKEGNLGEKNSQKIISFWPRSFQKQQMEYGNGKLGMFFSRILMDILIYPWPFPLILIHHFFSFQIYFRSIPVNPRPTNESNARLSNPVKPGPMNESNDRLSKPVKPWPAKESKARFLSNPVKPGPMNESKDRLSKPVKPWLPCKLMELIFSI